MSVIRTKSKNDFENNHYVVNKMSYREMEEKGRRDAEAKNKEYARFFTMITKLETDYELFLEFISIHMKDYFYKIRQGTSNIYYVLEKDGKWTDHGDANNLRVVLVRHLQEKLKMSYNNYVKNNIKEFFLLGENANEDIVNKATDTAKNAYQYVLQYLKSSKLGTAISKFPCSSPDKVKHFNTDTSIIPFNDNKCYDFKLGCVRNMRTNDYFTKHLEFDSSYLKDTTYDEEIMNILTGWLTPAGEDPDTETTQQLINAIYYMISGIVSRYLNLLTGDTLNGKSMFLKLLNGMKPFITPLSSKIFMEQKNPSSITSELVMLEKYRIGYFSEGSGVLNEELIKRITGGDDIVIRDLHKSEYMANVMCSLFMTCNRPPETTGENAINKRMRVWNFPNTYEVNPAFRTRVEKVLSPHFLGFIIRNHNSEPEKMTARMEVAKDVINKYNDILDQYIEEMEHFDYDKESKFKLQDLWEGMKSWYYSQEGKKLLKKDITNLLKNKSDKFEYHKRQNERYWTGLKKRNFDPVEDAL